MKPKENQEYGYVAGRVTAVAIEAALSYGVQEESLASLDLSKPYTFYKDERGLHLWNDFALILEKIYSLVDCDKEKMRTIGGIMVDCMTKYSYYKWAFKTISLRSAFKLHFRKSYNYFNSRHNNRIEGNIAIIEAWIIPAKDVFCVPFLHLNQGAVEQAARLFRTGKITVELEFDEKKRYCKFKIHLPPKRSIWNYLRHLSSMLFVGKYANDLIDLHAQDLNYIADQNQEKLDSLYGLIDNIKEAVLILRGDQVLTQNIALNTLCEGAIHAEWVEYFIAPHTVSDFLENHIENSSSSPCITQLRRDQTTPIEIIIQVISAKKVGQSIEAILIIHEANLPENPHEIISLAREQERKSLARDMHDGLGQLLTATSLQLATLSLTEKDEDRAVEIAQIEKMVREITLYSRKFTRQLDLLIDVCESIYDVVELIREEFSVVSGIQVRNNIKRDFQLKHPDSIRHIGYIIQEAMNNAFRHGRATEIALSIYHQEGSDILCIADDGIGMKDASARLGMGLRSMEYRVKQMGGQMRCLNGSEKGVIIECEFQKASKD